MPSSLDDYEVLSIIGSGSYGTCKKIARKKDGKILVWKELEYGIMSEVEKQMLVSEVNLLRELKHEHIVRYYDRIIDRKTFRLYIIMEYCEGGDLCETINNAKKNGTPVDEEFVWRICTQVVSALKVCHTKTEQSGKKILHRDLKPANVFLDANNNVKLGDFGLARVLSHETSFAKTFVGTPYYMSPEQMNYMSYNEKSDIWSVGCLLYELCALRPPFTAANQRELASRICVGRFNRIPMRYSEELNEVIKFMLQVDEFRRPSIVELCQHPLILKHSSVSAKPREEQRGSVCSDEGYSSRLLDTLRKKQESLAEKERQIAQKEKDLDLRERSLSLREKLAEERLARAERLRQEYAETRIKNIQREKRASTRKYSLEDSGSENAYNPDHVDVDPYSANTPVSRRARVATPQSARRVSMSAIAREPISMSPLTDCKHKKESRMKAALRALDSNARPTAGKARSGLANGKRPR